LEIWNTRKNQLRRRQPELGLMVVQQKVRL
jgi:hypothetical protein